VSRLWATVPALPRRALVVGNIDTIRDRFAEGVTRNVKADLPIAGPGTDATRWSQATVSNVRGALVSV
jgi:hypothetical protein